MRGQDGIPGRSFGLGARKVEPMLLSGAEDRGERRGRREDDYEERMRALRRRRR